LVVVVVVVVDGVVGVAGAVALEHAASVADARTMDQSE
jgi:hypothetical protein